MNKFDDIGLGMVRGSGAFKPRKWEQAVDLSHVNDSTKWSEADTVTKTSIGKSLKFINRNYINEDDTIRITSTGLNNHSSSRYNRTMYFSLYTEATLKSLQLDFYNGSTSSSADISIHKTFELIGSIRAENAIYEKSFTQEQANAGGDLLLDVTLPAGKYKIQVYANDLRYSNDSQGNVYANPYPFMAIINSTDNSKPGGIKNVLFECTTGKFGAIQRELIPPTFATKFSNVTLTGAFGGCCEIYDKYREYSKLCYDGETDISDLPLDRPYHIKVILDKANETLSPSVSNINITYKCVDDHTGPSVRPNINVNMGQAVFASATGIGAKNIKAVANYAGVHTVNISTTLQEGYVAKIDDYHCFLEQRYGDETKLTYCVVDRGFKPIQKLFIPQLIFTNKIEKQPDNRAVRISDNYIVYLHVISTVTYILTLFKETSNGLVLISSTTRSMTTPGTPRIFKSKRDTVFLFEPHTRDENGILKVYDVSILGNETVDLSPLPMFGAFQNNDKIDPLFIKEIPYSKDLFYIGVYRNDLFYYMIVGLVGKGFGPIFQNNPRGGIQINDDKLHFDVSPSINKYILMYKYGGTSSSSAYGKNSCKVCNESITGYNSTMSSSDNSGNTNWGFMAFFGSNAVRYLASQDPDVLVYAKGSGFSNGYKVELNTVEHFIGDYFQPYYIIRFGHTMLLASWSNSKVFMHPTPISKPQGYAMSSVRAGEALKIQSEGIIYVPNSGIRAGQIVGVDGAGNFIDRYITIPVGISIADDTFLVWDVMSEPDKYLRRNTFYYYGSCKPYEQTTPFMDLKGPVLLLPNALENWVSNLGAGTQLKVDNDIQEFVNVIHPYLRKHPIVANSQFKLNYQGSYSNNTLSAKHIYYTL